MLRQGSIIEMVISWNCDLDLNVDKCLPVYSFVALEHNKNNVAFGYNFR
jgi:hypothetical protein